MRKRLIVLSVFLVLQMFTLGFSQEGRGEKAVLEGVIQEALQENLQIKSAWREWQAALEKVPQAKALPDPVLSYSHFGSRLETRLGPQRNKISLSQKLPFFGKLAYKAEVAQSQAASFEADYEAVKADIVLRVKQIFFSLYWYESALRISQEEKELLRRLAQTAQKKYETGQANQQDILKAQLEASKVQEKILNLEQGRKAAAAELNALLNRAPDALVEKVEGVEIPSFSFELDELYDRAKESRPELKKVEHLIEKNEKSLKLAKKDFLPDFHLMFDYIDIGGGTTTLPEDGRNAWMGSVGVNIPLWRKKLRAAEAEQSIKLKASEDLYRNVTNETLSRVNEIYHEVKTLEEQIKLYTYSLLPQAEQSFKASEAGYLTGKVDFLNLLESERMVLMVKTGYHKSVSELRKSLAQLERMVGLELFNGKELQKTERTMNIPEGLSQNGIMSDSSLEDRVKKKGGSSDE